MPTLTHENGTVRQLCARTSIGRSHGSTLALPDMRVSTHHASLVHDGSAWTLTDLQSRNGTWLNGQLLTPSRATPVKARSVLRFGAADAPGWTFDPAPDWVIFANLLGTETQRAAIGNLLTLPDDDGPWSILSDSTGWVVEHDGQRHPIADGEILDAGGRWHLILAPIGDTVGPRRELSVYRARFLFSADADERNVKLSIEQDGKIVEMEPAEKWRLLLCLAQEYLLDPSDAESRGWISNEAVAISLGKEGSALSVLVTRTRQALCRRGFVDGADIIECRNGKMRLGVMPNGWEVP